jgi:tetratricopeptide (TPR) repeat protein
MENSKTLISLKHHIVFVCLLISLPILGQKQWYFSIEEKYPSESKYLLGKHRILVINNALTQPKDFGHSTIIDGDNTELVPIDLDKSLLYTIFSTTQTMDQSGEFDAVEPLEFSQNKSTNFYSRTPLSYTQSERLCSDYQVDVLLILNQLVLYDVFESFSNNEGKYYAYIQAYAQSHWTIHYAGQYKDINLSIADTLLWESQLCYNRAQSLKELPPRQEALLYLAQELGTKVGNQFIPSWKTTRRYFYEMDELKEGINAFQYQRWEQAIELWKSALETKDKKTAACAAANIAIAYEMMGDYDEASAYAAKAYRLFGAWKTAYGRQQQANIRYYQELLQEKKAREAYL